MRTLIPIVLTLAPALAMAEMNRAVPREKLVALSLLPPGSQLHGVMLPRYDENLRLAGVMNLKTMTLVDQETIAGTSVSVRFFNPDRTERGRVDLQNAVFNQSKGLLEAHEEVSLRSDRLNARGNGLVYDIELGKGFLIGPATTWIHPQPEPPMSSSLPSLRQAGLAGLTLISTAIGPDATAAETSDAPPHDPSAAVESTRKELRETLDASAAANAAAKAFLEKAELTTEPANPDAEVPPPALNPNGPKQGPDDTVISCDGGMYFDADQGMFVYLKNVKVDHPQFTLTAANDLKVFLAKKADGGKETTAVTDPSAGTGRFGDVDRIVATGAVVMKQKKTAEVTEPVEASGAMFTYNAKSGQAVLSGGKPWFVRGRNAMRALEPNLSVRIDRNGNAVTEGKWETILHLESR